MLLKVVDSRHFIWEFLNQMQEIWWSVLNSSSSCSSSSFCVPSSPSTFPPPHPPPFLSLSPLPLPCPSVLMSFLSLLSLHPESLPVFLLFRFFSPLSLSPSSHCDWCLHLFPLSSFFIFSPVPLSSPASSPLFPPFPCQSFLMCSSFLS